LRKYLLPFSLESISLSKHVKFKIYRTLILPVVLYGHETWSFTSREEHELKVFENRVLRKVFGSKRDKTTGYWRRLANEELHDLPCSPNINLVIKPGRKRCVGHAAYMGETREAYRVSVGKLSEKCNLSDLGIDWRVILK
jgi:hypothetical protein